MYKLIAQIKKLSKWQTLIKVSVIVLALVSLAIVIWPASKSTKHKIKWTPNIAFAIPIITDDGWEKEDLDKAGFNSANFYKFFEELINEENNIHSLIVERHGKLVAELYQKGTDKKVNNLFSQEIDFSPSVLHDTRSVGKSIISLLVGIAKQQDKINSLQTPVIDFYPEYGDLATPGLKLITLEHLLTMSSGFEWNEGGEGANDEHRLMWKWSPYYYVLSRPVKSPPGQQFNYNSGGTALLADIVTKTTNISWEEYANKFLFEPLKIKELEWVQDFHGRPMAYTGLRMLPRDMAKIGRLVLNNGKWQGKQIVSQDWIEQSLKPRLTTGFDNIEYGYQWWVGTLEWKGKYLQWGAAFGNGSQRLFVVPALDITIVITAGDYDDIKVARRVNRFFKDIISTVEDSQTTNQ